MRCCTHIHTGTYYLPSSHTPIDDDFRIGLEVGLLQRVPTQPVHEGAEVAEHESVPDECEDRALRPHPPGPLASRSPDQPTSQAPGHTAGPGVAACREGKAEGGEGGWERCIQT